MSLPIPLTVRVATGRSDRVITREVRDLEFRSTVPGGFAAATVDLDRPLTIQPDEIDYFGRLVITDQRTGMVVWEGLLEDPGRSAGKDGQVWKLAGIGPSGHVHDRTVPLIYVDRTLGNWVVSQYQQPYVTSGGADNDTTPALRMKVPKNTIVSTGRVCDMTHRALVYAGQKLARVRADWICGFADPNFLVQLITGTTVAGTTTPATTGSTAVGGTLVARLASDTGSMVNGEAAVSVNLFRTTSSTTIADDAVWVKFSNIAVRALLLDKAGSEVTTGYSADTVLSSEVVADLLGRLLPRFDGAGASIAATSYAITQLAYPDGVDPGKVLSDLMGFDPAFYWAAWEQQPNGKYRFEWVAWPTVVRYEADVRDGFDSPGSADDLYSGVRVRYRDDNGEIKTVYRTQTVAVLAAAGVIRDAFLDLGDAAGGLTNAQRAGDQFLADHAFAPNAGKLTIARPIVDLLSGRTVAPWEIRPGALIRVRGVLPRVDALNATARDGVTVFRVVGAGYRASSAAAQLELDSYPPTVARALADLQARPVTARR